MSRLWRIYAELWQFSHARSPIHAGGADPATLLNLVLTPLSPLLSTGGVSSPIDVRGIFSAESIDDSGSYVSHSSKESSILEFDYAEDIDGFSENLH